MSETPTTTCGDSRDGFTCTLAPHDPTRVDHAEQVIAPNGVRAASYTRAFWNYGQGITRLDRVIVVDPYLNSAVAR